MRKKAEGEMNIEISITDAKTIIAFVEEKFRRINLAVEAGIDNYQDGDYETAQATKRLMELVSEKEEK